MTTENKTPEELAAEKEARDGQLRQADYTKKTQELAEERKRLEAERQEWLSIKQREAEALEVAKNLKAAYDENDLVKAAVNGDKAALKKLVSDIDDPDEIKTVKQEIEKLKMELKQREQQEKNNQFNDFVKAEGRKLIKDELGLTDEDLAVEMENVRKKNNPYYTWARSAALEKAVEKAKQEGIRLGREEAINEWHRKLNNTRPVSDGNGVNNEEGESDTKVAAAKALEKIRRAQSG